MRIPTNHIRSIIGFFRSELKPLYSEGEIDAFVRMAFDKLMGYSATKLLISKDETVSESMLLKFNSVVKGLRNKKPIQYILGEAEFMGLHFKVNENVLIPRQETLELVDWIRQDYSSCKGLHLLDIGTGSGCIAISLKYLLPDMQLTAWDVSEEALEVAKANAEWNKVLVDFAQVDVLNTAGLKGKWDVIVSNPPYVTVKEKQWMHENVLSNEPHLALFVEDDDPLLFYRSIMEAGKRLLNPQGCIYFEINEQFGKELQDLSKTLGFQVCELRKDIFGKDRMLKLRLCEK